MQAASLIGDDWFIDVARKQRAAQDFEAASSQGGSTGAALAPYVDEVGAGWTACCTSQEACGVCSGHCVLVRNSLFLF